MADIFLSYVREDLKRAKVVVCALQENGWTVWWDRYLAPGPPFRQVIGREFEAATCVVVLWSTQSVDSEFVLDEAELAKERQVLVSAKIDRVRLPLGFGQRTVANLVGWTGDTTVDEFRLLVRGITELVPPKARPAVTSPPVQPRSKLSTASHPKRAEAKDFGFPQRMHSKRQVVGIFNLVELTALNSNRDLIQAVSTLEIELDMALSTEFYGSSAESVGEMQPVDLTGWCPALGKPRVFHSPTGPTNADPF